MVSPRAIVTADVAMTSADTLGPVALSHASTNPSVTTSARSVRGDSGIIAQLVADRCIAGDGECSRSPIVRREERHEPGDGRAARQLTARVKARVVRWAAPAGPVRLEIVLLVWARESIRDELVLGDSADTDRGTGAAIDTRDTSDILERGEIRDMYQEV